MRVAIVILLLSSVTACWTLERQMVALSEAQTAALEAKWGNDLDAMQADIEHMLNADVVSVVKGESGRLEAVLSPPLHEALATGAESFVERATGLTPADALAGAILGALGIGGTLRWRSQYRKPTTRKK